MKFKKWLVFPSLGAVLVFLTICVVFSVLSRQFFTFDTIASIFTIAAELGAVTLAVATLMIAGEFDLSVGAVYATAGIILASLLSAGISSIVAIIAVLLFALVIGSINGVLTTKARIPSFIVTLGTMMTLRGLLLVATKGFPVSYHGSSPLIFLLNGRFAGSFRLSMLWLLAFLVLFVFLLNRTRHGNWTYAVGGNAEVARTLGVKVNRVKIINFLLTATFAAIAGAFSFARFKMAYPTLGEGLELETIASAVLGGCYLSGGYGTIVGAFFGVLVISSLRVGLVLAGAPAYWYKAFIGIILILGMTMNKNIMRAILGKNV